MLIHFFYEFQQKKRLILQLTSCLPCSHFHLLFFLGCGQACWKSCRKVAEKLPKSCRKVAEKLSKSCWKSCRKSCRKKLSKNKRVAGSNPAWSLIFLNNFFVQKIKLQAGFEPFCFSTTFFDSFFDNFFDNFSTTFWQLFDNFFNMLDRSLNITIGL